MDAQMLVVLDILNNHIQHAVSELQSCLEKRHKVLAVIREYPRAILQADKAEFLHRTAQPIAGAPAPFRHVEDDNPPPAVPLPLPLQTEF